MVEAGAGGSIVNVSSGAQCGLEVQGTYSASKAAVATYTYSWARDLIEHGIRVNAISPNAITAQHEQLAEQFGFHPEAHHTAFPSTEDNAAVVVYLLSDASAKLNGQVVRVAHESLSLMSHPLIIEPGASMGEWTPDAVAAAFAAGLDEQVQPLGVAFGEVRPSRVVF
jgi:short-subunit dehydrogenase